jgi:hypothetical protein
VSQEWPERWVCSWQGHRVRRIPSSALWLEAVCLLAMRARRTPTGPWRGAWQERLQDAPFPLLLPVQDLPTHCTTIQGAQGSTLPRCPFQKGRICRRQQLRCRCRPVQVQSQPPSATAVLCLSQGPHRVRLHCRGQLPAGRHFQPGRECSHRWPLMPDWLPKHMCWRRLGTLLPSAARPAEPLRLLLRTVLQGWERREQLCLWPQVPALPIHLHTPMNCRQGGWLVFVEEVPSVSWMAMPSMHPCMHACMHACMTAFKPAQMV